MKKRYKILIGIGSLAFMFFWLAYPVEMITYFMFVVPALLISQIF